MFPRKTPMSLADPRTVDDLLNYRLSRLFAASGAMVIRLCEGKYGITRREWRLIALLAAHGAMSPSDLAARAHLERARTSRHITELTARKLIRRVPVPEDGRRAQVDLTPRAAGSTRSCSRNRSASTARSCPCCPRANCRPSKRPSPS
ncbi:MarR family winged helix-turn-helix transcriptional regulator [Ramlibacter montanisoli]|uniref:MarR family transcriptional regulator n=1 Tax=Ramlibacter montanisoli TaxID=2732512 RepID=A0A849KET9_9BURK|nr:MarR family transcriptional regulator [Ramlibacter montanisoli]NNU42723.1 MarR family transcriptional regulator [Ramlibacter montanisoli]